MQISKLILLAATVAVGGYLLVDLISTRRALAWQRTYYNITQSRIDIYFLGDDAQVHKAVPQLQTLISEQKVEQTNVILMHEAGDAAINAIVELPGITAKTIESNQVTDDGLLLLQPLNELKSLRVHSPRVTSIGVEYVTRLGSLKYLDINGTSADNECVDALERMPQLNNVNTTATQITRRVILLRERQNSLKERT